MSNTELPPGAVLLPDAPPAGLPPGAVLLQKDKYQQAAEAERARILALQGSASVSPLPEGYTRRLTQGLGMNWTDEAMAGMMTAPETVYRGITKGDWNPIEAYKYARARELGSLEASRENTGTLGSATEVLGGLATGGRAVIGALPAAGQAAIKQAPGVLNAVGRYAGNVGKGSVLGGISGAGEGTDLTSRAINTAIGGAFGGGVAAVLPVVAKAVSPLAAPIVNQFRRFASKSPTAPISNVEDVAVGQIAKTIERAGKADARSGKPTGSWEPARIDPTTGQPVPARFVTNIEREVTDANAAGQPMILAEGIGLEGQRRLAAIAKSPGTARQWIDEDLGQRDLARALRAREAVNTGLGVPRGQTAEMAQEALTREAQTRSRPFYQAAEAKQPVWSTRMQEFFDHPEYQKALKEGFHIERTKALADGRPFNPRDYAITDFDAAGDPIMSAVPNMKTIDLMKKGVDVILNKHRDPLTRKLDTTDPYINALQRSQRAMLKEVDSLNPVYARARAEYAGPAQVATAVREGRKLPDQGLPEDTIRRMKRLPETDLQGTRIGLADRIATQLMKGTETGPLPAYLRNPKGRQELDFLSLHQGPRQPIPPNPMARASDPVRFQPDPMRRALEREATMRSTYAQARGGSQTAENLGDMLDTAVPPEVDAVGVIGNALAGNWMGAAKNLLPAAGRIAKGETEAQREAMARILMQRDAAEMAATMQRITDLQARQQAAATARVGALGSGAGELAGDPPELQRIYINRP